MKSLYLYALEATNESVTYFHANVSRKIRTFGDFGDIFVLNIKKRKRFVVELDHGTQIHIIQNLLNHEEDAVPLS